MLERRLNIGLDFDDTLMHTREAIVDLLNAAHGTSTRVTDCTEYWLSERWNLTNEAFSEFFTLHEPAIHTQPALAGMLPTLQAWSAFADFRVITGRPLAWLPSAQAWLDQQGIRIKELVSSSADGTKGIAAKRMKLDFFIDDHEEAATQVADAGIPVFLIDQPYNQNCRHPLITRVRGWNEISSLVMERWPLDSGVTQH